MKAYNGRISGLIVVNLMVAVLLLSGTSWCQTYPYLPGDVNMYYGNWPPSIQTADVTYLINYLKQRPTSIRCVLDTFWAAADVNGDCQLRGSDVSRLVGYLKGQADIRYCPQYIPLWPTPDSLPPSRPIGFPGCEVSGDLPPLLEAVAPASVRVGQRLDLRLTATDSPGDPIFLFALGLPPNAVFVDSANGVGGFSFRPTLQQLGAHQITFIAFANALADTVQTVITVIDTAGSSSAIVADHFVVSRFAAIPDSTIRRIRSNTRIYYAHSSHGAQLIQGMSILHAQDTLYSLPSIHEVADDLGEWGDTSWAPPTRVYLNAHPEINVVMYSWCIGLVRGHNDSAGIYAYLNKLDELGRAYPGVAFVYMTGPLDGSGNELYGHNTLIRNYCRANGKVLFDFGDIECHDPDGNYYPGTHDYCEWCYDWCAANPCPTCTNCSHSHCFNCYRKGMAFWWLLARLSGWSDN